MTLYTANVAAFLAAMDDPTGEKRMTGNAHGPYMATFVGGILDGASYEVQSLAPSRLAAHGRAQPPYAVAWDGKPRPGVFDVYDIDRPDETDRCVYRFVRTMA